MTVPPSAAVKTERLLNLVIALLSTRMPLSKARIWTAVPQYQGTASVEAFDRMFERDKDELRELGIPLVTAVIDPLFDDELGYRIDRREYALPEIHFEPDEVAALSLAARAWARASLAGPAAAAMRKLRSAGVEMDDSSIVGIEPVVRTTEDAFEPLRRAVFDRQVVTFGYRKLEGESTLRRLEPWGLTQWHGRWYVTGHDLDRDGLRVFRLGRIDSEVTTTGLPGAYEVPQDHDPRTLVETTQPPERPDRTAMLLVRDGAGNTLRRRATSVVDATSVDTRAVDTRAVDTTAVDTTADGDAWSRLTVAFGGLDRLADEVSGFGPDVVALEPDDLRHAVVRRLTGARTRHTRELDGERP